MESMSSGPSLVPKMRWAALPSVLHMPLLIMLTSAVILYPYMRVFDCFFASSKYFKLHNNWDCVCLDSPWNPLRAQRKFWTESKWSINVCEMNKWMEIERKNIIFIWTYFLKYVYLFIYWLCWVLFAARGLFSLVVVSRGHSSLQCAASYWDGLSCSGAWALGVRASVVAACGLCSCGSQALGRSGFSSCGLRAQ